jgi:predicted nuclease with TOPRIM domain
MPFTVRDFQSLVRALDRRAAWKAELRRLLLTEDLLSLPQVVRELAAEQTRLTAEVRELAAGQARLTTEVRELAAGQAQLTAEQTRLTAEVQELAAGQARLTAEVQELAAGQARLTAEVQELAAGQAQLTAEQTRLTAEVRELAAGQARLTAEQTRLTAEVRELAAGQARLTAEQTRLTAEVRELTAAQRLMSDRLARLEGSDLERRYRERAPAFFQRVLSRIRVVDHQELGMLLDAAVETGTLTLEEKGEVLLSDVVVRGRRDQQDAYLLAEVSLVVDADDVRRAASRARLLERATAVPVLAAVAGHQVTPDAEREALVAGVWRVVDGRVDEPVRSGSG